MKSRPRDIIVFRDRRKFVDWDKIYPNFGYLDAEGKKEEAAPRFGTGKKLNTRDTMLVIGGGLLLYYIVFIYVPLNVAKN